MELGQNKWDFYKPHWPDQIEVAIQIAGVKPIKMSPNISYSKAKEIHACPFAYFLKREKKIVFPMGKPAFMGSVFDGLCSYGLDALEKDPDVIESMTELDKWDIQKIIDRYEEFRPHRDQLQGEVQKPILKKLLGGSWIVIGFIDMKALGSDGDPFCIDWKWSMRPWYPKKFEAAKVQLHNYCYCDGASWGKFIVANDAKAGIQGLGTEYQVHPGPQDTAKIEQHLLDAIVKITSGERQATPSKDACQWCDYKEMCDAYRG